MLLNRVKQKDSLLVKLTIYSLIISIICFNVLAIIKMFFGNVDLVQPSNVSEIIINGDIILSILVLICCYTFYYIYKEDDMFIISQVYTIIAIRFIIINIFSDSIQNIVKDNYLTITIVYVYQGILLSLIAYKENILFKCMLKNKLLLGVSIPTLYLLILSGGVSKLIPNGNSDYEMLAYCIVGIVIFIHFLLVYLLFKKSIKTKRIIYSIFGASINILTIDNLYKLHYYNRYSNDIILLGYIFVFLAFLIIIIGLFYEMIFKAKEVEELRHKLGIFSAANEKNLNSRILVYDENYNIIYANELARQIVSSERGIKEQYDVLKKRSIFNEDNDTSEKAKQELDKKGIYSNVFYTHDLKEYYRADLQKVVTDTTSWIIGTFVNVTHEYEMIHKLAISENKLKNVTENILDFIITMDNNGIITFANASAIDALGFSYDEFVGNTYKKFLYKDNDEVFIINNIEKNIVKKHKILCKDGSFIRVESVIRRIRSDFDGYIISSRNLEIKEELESLKIKYNEIKEYDRIRSEFFANLSHEVRTPINIIHTCLQLLNNQKDNGAEALEKYYIKYEKTIRQNAFRLLRLVNNLIDISKLDNEAMEIKKQNENIINLIENVTLSTVPYVEAKNINIMFDTEVEELVVECDAEKIERVVLNLISNSVKFTPQGGEIIVDIKLDDKWVYVRVKDTGIGIPIHLQEVIFERFVQGDKSFNRKNEGSGIGLALVKDIIEKHNGKVMVEESSEKGSTFLVKLPNVHKEDIVIKKNSKDAVKTEIKEKIDIEFSDIYDY